MCFTLQKRSQTLTDMSNPTLIVYTNLERNKWQKRVNTARIIERVGKPSFVIHAGCVELPHGIARDQ